MVMVSEPVLDPVLGMSHVINNDSEVPGIASHDHDVKNAWNQHSILISYNLKTLNDYSDSETKQLN